jgi:ATP-dependent Clp protease adapter protein ClpS
MSEILSHGGEMPCTRCTRDIAETKIEQVMDFIEENPYTIECTIKES